MVRYGLEQYKNIFIFIASLFFCAFDGRVMDLELRSCGRFSGGGSGLYHGPALGGDFRDATESRNQVQPFHGVGLLCLRSHFYGISPFN